MDENTSQDYSLVSAAIPKEAVSSAVDSLQELIESLTLDPEKKQIFERKDYSLKEIVSVFQESGLTQETINRYLMKLCFESKKISLYELLSYATDHADQFRGLGANVSLLERDDFFQNCKYFIQNSVKAGKDTSQILNALSEIFSLTDQENSAIISHLYLYYTGALEMPWGVNTLQALVRDKALNTEGERAEVLLKQGLVHQMQELEEKFSRNSSQKRISSDELDVYKLTKIEQSLKKIFGISPDISSDPYITRQGQKLFRTMSTSDTDVSVLFPQIRKLTAYLPNVLQGNFEVEGKSLWEKTVWYGSFSRVKTEKDREKFGRSEEFDREIFALLEKLGFETEDVKGLIKATLIEVLSSNHPRVLSGLIETYVRPNEHFADLLQNPEVLSTARLARKHWLGVFSENHYQEICQTFNLATEWDNTEDLRIVRDSLIERIPRISGISELKSLHQEWDLARFFNDQEIQEAIENAILYDPSPWRRISKDWLDAKEVFTTWNLPLEKLQDYVKAFVLERTKMIKGFLSYTELTKCLEAFPEILQSLEVQGEAIKILQSIRYKKGMFSSLDPRFSYYLKDVKKFVDDFQIEPEVFSQWKIRIAVNSTHSVTDQKAFSLIYGKTFSDLELTPTEHELTAHECFLQTLDEGGVDRALFLKKAFETSKVVVNFGKIDTEQLQAAGHSGIEQTLFSNNLKGAIKIQELCSVPVEFFNDAVLEQLANLLATEFLCKGLLGDLNKAIQLFGLSSQTESAIDKFSSQNKSFLKNVMVFFKYLGEDEIIIRFPKTFEIVREHILSVLPASENYSDYFVENLHLYHQQPWVTDSLPKALSHFSVVEKFIATFEQHNNVWANQSWVQPCLAIARKVVEEHKASLQKQSDDFDDNDDSEDYEVNVRGGFSEKDHYHDHPGRLTARQIRLASVVSDIMTGKAPESKIKELGLSPESLSIIHQVERELQNAYENFLKHIANSKMGEDDVNTILDPQYKGLRTTPLLDTVRNLVARYLVQGAASDINNQEITPDGIRSILSEGFERYIKVNEVDIPLYDKLYEEFDNYRESGRYPLEVFLGRDGIYAWIGRRAQDVARRRMLGLEARTRLKEQGEVLEINPRYLVYPRYFRDNLNTETKQKFLEQEGISPDADPIFYDTGYTGTIPEQIMNIMGFDKADIEKRIKLLSAKTSARRVRGVSANARAEIIEYIEHNAKAENTAEGLIIDDRTGKIRHIAQPTSPEEQFYFMMVKQAIVRHYWVKEQLHHVPSGNVYRSSEDYNIRVKQEYADLLPQDFLADPQRYLTEHGELLKGSEGEGEFPDEEILLFTLTDGTEVVAKRIELRKAQEAQKEHSILVAAQKAGLATAEPVGFLSAKQTKDGSYLLMKKLEGISGRNIDRYLEETGRYSPEQIQKIIGEITAKNREIAAQFREILGVDKRWRIKDTIVQLNEETGEVESVIPIDWERVQNYDPYNPKEID